MGGFNYANDVSVIDGEKEVKVDFTFNSDDVSADELKAEGFTVNGSRASKTTVCKTRKYIFKQLPQTVDDFEGFSLDTEFGPVAATICAFAAADVDHYNMQNIDSCPTCAILDRLNGKCSFNNFDKQHLASSVFNNLRAEGAKNCFFAGAATENGYTPDLPLSFELYVGPYEIPAKVNPATGINRPATLMVLLSFGGDDSERYMDVYHSADGNWYGWADQWKHMGAAFKPAKVVW